MWLGRFSELRRKPIRNMLDSPLQLLLSQKSVVDSSGRTKKMFPPCPDCPKVHKGNRLNSQQHRIRAAHVMSAVARLIAARTLKSVIPTLASGSTSGTSVLLLESWPSS